MGVGFKNPQKSCILIKHTKAIQLAAHRVCGRRERPSSSSARRWPFKAPSSLGPLYDTRWCDREEQRAVGLAATSTTGHWGLSGMGCFFTRFLWRSVYTRRKRLLIYGLDGSGKTALLFRLKLGNVISTVPTADVNIETFSVTLRGKQRREAWNLTFYDVGYRDPVRPLWREYHLATDYVVFVIDSADRRRINTAREELLALMYEEHFAVNQAKFLVYANKQDLPVAMTRSEVEYNLDLPRELAARWRVVPCSVMTGEGLLEGLEWLMCGVTPDSSQPRPPSPPKDIAGYHHHTVGGGGGWLRWPWGMRNGGGDHRKHDLEFGMMEMTPLESRSLLSGESSNSAAAPN
ncbi:unnamed protein product [Vitrella brassicaformis CCMP3155]|uniref:Uncharacterized protein n=1 Tax=Vitrella brassicaformis (strain CCMP3155) TaxID=1169540 RepID=A0A0G4G046_VITBC|nr:unnamed protein product [Vitrella brassicaformis CCMP3155]|eukprot:CEM21192.1 unnamed protein product [Vitrella brassicaformis CCMP3155]